MIVYCEEDIVADKVRIADSFVKRLCGLMGKKKLDEGEGLLLVKCASIHCFFMKIPIDVIYLSKDRKVLDVETLKPWHIGKHVRKAAHVLELREGAAAKIKGGNLIRFSDAIEKERK